MNHLGVLTEQDQTQLESSGLSMDDAMNQLARLREGPVSVVLDRPCTLGDGIEQLSQAEHASLIEAHRRAADRGRWTKFVPASGAASRMFALKTEEEQRKFSDAFDQLAFSVNARNAASARGLVLEGLRKSGKIQEFANAVVSSEGLGYGSRPKGLLEFHFYPNQIRTAFEEQLHEAVACLGSGDGKIDCHFTVSADNLEEFERVARDFLESQGNAASEIHFSVQQPSTDTVALGEDGQLLRDDAGHPVTRPGGHGALLRNLSQLNGDLVFVKNIDNIAHETGRDVSHTWIQILGGYLVRLEEAVHGHLKSLSTGEQAAVLAAAAFVEQTFPNSNLPPQDDLPALQSALEQGLRRPLRVCGMVKNDGEPGGGPFWIHQRDGSKTAQIVESAEVSSDEQQQAILRQATHFNPVFMALALRDESGEAYDLSEFVDEDRAIITRKMTHGQTATVLERPGLWNGSMARWNTIFIEVPSEVFSPVKTVLDLLRPEHRG